jgi:Zn-dependent peptidase ImmA (M78 family)
MTYPVSEDPASSLWLRVGSAELEKIAPLLDQVPVHVGAIAELLGIEVISITLTSDISGLIKKVNSYSDSYQIQINNTDAAARQRFTVAHELAHYLLHRRSIGTDGVTDSILYRSKLSDRVEAEANRLAAAILLPWSRVRAWHQEHYQCEPDVNHLEELAKAFRVSSLAVGFRFGF